MNHRRRLVLIGIAAACAPVLAHHGWSSFDQDRPLFLSGTVKSVRWQNPHVELIAPAAIYALGNADLPGRKAPAQSQSVDGNAVLGKAAVPAQSAGDWEIELAPLSRVSAWGVAELKPGDRVEVVGYALASGDRRVLRVEYLFAQGKAFGMRSSPQ